MRPGTDLLAHRLLGRLLSGVVCSVGATFVVPPQDQSWDAPLLPALVWGVALHLCSTVVTRVLFAA